jgi:hypothetical protein
MSYRGSGQIDTDISFVVANGDATDAMPSQRRHGHVYNRYNRRSNEGYGEVNERWGMSVKGSN